MKILIPIAVLLIALSTRGCAEDSEEDEIEITTVDGVGYVAEDVKIRKALDDWGKFRKEADSVIFAARVQISEATDCYDDPKTPNRRRLKSAIIDAEARIEKLSTQMLKAKKYGATAFTIDDAAIEEMQAFKDDFSRKQGQLNESLIELKKRY